MTKNVTDKTVYKCHSRETAKVACMGKGLWYRGSNNMDEEQSGLNVTCLYKPVILI